MKKYLALLALALTMLTGCAASAVADTKTPIPAVDNDGPGIQEDDPAWDCWTMGNRTCGANPIQRTEAWGLFDTSDVPADTLREAFKVTYRGLALEGVDFPPSSVVTIPSPITPGKVHVFEISKL